MKRPGLLLVIAGATTVALAVGVVRADLSQGLGAAAATADAVVGVAFVVVALLTASSPWRERALMAGVGLAWFLGGFPPLAGVHRAVLVQALLSFPDGRLGSLRRRLVVVAMYLLTLLSGSVLLSAVGFGLAALVAAGPRGTQGQPAWTSRGGGRLYPVLGAASMAIVLGVEALAEAMGSGVGADQVVAVYEGALVAVALGYPFAVRAWRRAPRAVADLVVQLGPGGGLGAFGQALARLADDPGLRVLEWDPARGAFVDELDGLAELPTEESRILRVQDNGRPLAVVLHDPASLREPGMVQAADVAVRLAVHHSRLRREERAQISELSSSRDRLLMSADTQRERIADRLHARVERPATALAAQVSALHGGTPGSEGLVRSAAAELMTVASELDALTHGSRPPGLDRGGLVAAIDELAIRSPVPVQVDNRLSQRPTASVETAAYFVCAEALANATKHARASAVVVTLEASDGVLRLSIRDDGVGGADQRTGTGLSGLGDRVGALGGRLLVESRPHAGTTVTALLPMSAADAPPRV